MRRRVVGFGTSLLVAAGFVAMTVAASSPDPDEWPCRELMVIHGSVGTGDRSEGEALQRAVLLLTNLAPGYPADKAETEVALASTSGDNRYSASDGRLFVDGILMAQFQAERAADGTYSVGDITTCAPDAGMGEPTPEAG